MTTFEKWVQQRVSRRQFQAALEQSGDTTRGGSVKAQARTIDRIYSLLGQEGANLRSQSDLAAQIYMDLRNKVAEWGDKAYPLTEKQVAVFIRDFEKLAAEADAVKAFEAEHGYRW